MKYTLRNPQASDLFVVTKMLKTIGLKNIKNALMDNDEIKALRDMFKKENTYVEDGVTKYKSYDESQLTQASLCAILCVGDLILDKADLMQNDLFKFISNLSELKVEEVKSMNIVDFAEITSDILHMPDFVDFIKVVLKSFK